MTTTKETRFRQMLTLPNTIHTTNKYTIIFITNDGVKIGSFWCYATDSQADGHERHHTLDHNKVVTYKVLQIPIVVLVVYPQ